MATHEVAAERGAPGAKRRLRRERRGSTSAEAGGEILGKVLAAFAGLTTLTLLMGFPAVALQYRSFGVPLDVAPERAFLLAGVPPTMVVVAAVLVFGRVPRLSINPDQPPSPWQMLRSLGPFSFPLLVAWMLVLPAFAAMNLASAKLAADAAIRFADIDVRGSWLAWTLAGGLLILLVGGLLKLRGHSRAFKPLLLLSALGSSLAVMYRATGAWGCLVPFVPLLLGLPYVLLRSVEKIWSPRLSVEDLKRLVTFVPFLMVAASSVTMAVVFAEIFRASLVVLGVISSSTDHAAWVLVGLVFGVTAGYGQVVMGTSMFVGISDRRLGFGDGRPVVNAASVLLVVALLLIHSFGLYPRFPKSILGGRPDCVSEVVVSGIPLDTADGRQMLLADDEAAVGLGRVCILAFSSDDVVACRDNRAPTSCVVLQRDSVASLLIRSGAQ